MLSAISDDVLHLASGHPRLSHLKYRKKGDLLVTAGAREETLEKNSHTDR